MFSLLLPSLMVQNYSDVLVTQFTTHFPETKVSKPPSHLERLDEGVEKDPHTHASSQQLYQPADCKLVEIKQRKQFKPRGSEQFEEANLNKFSDVDNAANNSDEVKRVPGVFEIVLKEGYYSSHIVQFICIPQTLGP